MTELILNGTSIVLPAGFSFPFIKENPILTKNGEYSLDIEISLLNETNVRFFNHIDRFNASKDKSLSSAILIVDNHVELNGNARIIAVNNVRIKIQILSGNSELNYICDDKLMLSDMDFGSVTETITLESAVELLTKKWPAANYICVRNYISNKIYNNIDGTQWDAENPMVEWSAYAGNIYNIQPYVMYYFNQIIAKLGYTITENILEGDDFFNRLIIFGGTTSLNYNDSLPNWTILHFLEQIEKLGNIVYVIDKITKSVRIMRSSTHYNSAEKHYVPDGDILDDYDSEPDDNNYGVLNYQKIKYNLDSSDYFKSQSLSDEVIKASTLEVYYTFLNLVAAYPTNTDRQAAYKTMKLFKINDGNYYNYYIIALKGTAYYFKRINIFREVNSGIDTDEYIELDIVPIEFKVDYIPSVSEVIPNEGEITDLNVIINNGISTVEKPKVLRCGISLGLYPISSTTENIEGTGSSRHSIVVNDCFELDIYHPYEYQISEFSFRFNGFCGLSRKYYNSHLNIDSTKKWTILFKWKNEYDERNYFIFRGRKYFCEKIEVDGDIDKTGGFVTGTFYSVT